ncbi:MAG: shikimate kinase AroK [Succinivibrionaceae bacterium]
MSKAENIFLVGPMGAGKSTIGRFLADSLNLEFVDSDNEIEIRTGASISWIFDVEGESGFRKREAQIIEELTLRNGIVLSTGGGAIKDPANRRFLKERGTVIYLHTPVEKQFQRTCKDKRRPLLQNNDPRVTLEQLMIERDPLYRETADIVVETSELTAKAVAQNIISIVNHKE